MVFVKLLLWLRLLFREAAEIDRLAAAGRGRACWWAYWDLYLPEVLGVGYDYMERVLDGDMARAHAALRWWC